jgi:hypothetical protein
MTPAELLCTNDVGMMDATAIAGRRSSQGTVICGVQDAPAD